MSNIFAFKTMGATFDGALLKEKIKLAVPERTDTEFQTKSYDKILHKMDNTMRHLLEKEYQRKE